MRAVAGHLQDSTVNAWDKKEARYIRVPAFHPKLVITNDEFKANFVDSLVKSLIKAKVISSPNEILDGRDYPSWQKNSIRTDGTPVNGIRSDPGYRCKKCSMAGRSWPAICQHKHISGEFEGKKAKSSDVDIDDKIKVQTFSEVYSIHFVIQSEPLLAPILTPLSNHDNDPDAALEFLVKEQSRIMETVPNPKSIAPDSKALPPIFHSGIEQWLKEFDRKILHSRFPSIPHAQTQKSSSMFSYLRRVVFKLFAQDLSILEADKIHHEVAHIITNGSWYVI